MLPYHHWHCNYIPQALVSPSTLQSPIIIDLSDNNTKVIKRHLVYTHTLLHQKTVKVLPNATGRIGNKRIGANSRINIKT